MPLTAARPLPAPAPVALGLVGLWLVVAIASLGAGPVALGPEQVLAAVGAPLGLAGADPLAEAVVWTLRLPRIALATAVGGGLAGAGALTQGLFRNPLADPGLIGVTGGASLGAALAIVLGAGTGALALAGVAGAAFLGALATTTLVLAVAAADPHRPVATMLLAGIGVQALTGCALGVLLTLSDDAGLRSITFWLMGSLGGATLPQAGLVGGVIAVGGVVAWRLSAELDVLLLGDDAARHLGVRPERVQRATVAVVACVVGAATALTGAIGFVGLVVPHIARALVGARHRVLLPTSVAAGAVLLTAADTLSRTLIAPAELPVGLLTTALGAPFFLSLLLRRRGP